MLTELLKKRRNPDIRINVPIHNHRRVAIVGSGCSGLAALWALNSSTGDEVHLYEAADRLGGHTNTVSFEHNGFKTNVDTGFIAMNSATYPNFINFLGEVGVPTVDTRMTFGVSRDQGVFEWAGTSLSSIFAQRSNLFNRRVWRMLFDIIRFNQFAVDLLLDVSKHAEDQTVDALQVLGSSPWLRTLKPQHEGLHESIGQYLDREGYSDAFKNDYLIPMTAAIWSTSADQCSLDFPVVTLVRFMYNHHLLSTVSTRPTWMTIKGGSRAYIHEIMKDFPADRVHLSTKVEALFIGANGGIQLKTKSLEVELFDHVILAIHGSQALDIMRFTIRPHESDILSCFETIENVAVLHSDPSLMPKLRVAWSAWNCLTTTSTESLSSVCLTYWMNLLQHIPESTFGPVFVTLNPLHMPDPSAIQGTWIYHHPLYNGKAIAGQSQLASIQNTRGISYAGAWTKYGFHEDGFLSGLKVAVEHLDATLPFRLVDSTFSRGRYPVLGWQDHLVRLFVRVVQILIILWDLALNTAPIRSLLTKVSTIQTKVKRVKLS